MPGGYAPQIMDWGNQLQGLAPPQGFDPNAAMALMRNQAGAAQQAPPARPLPPPPPALAGDAAATDQRLAGQGFPVVSPQTLAYLRGGAPQAPTAGPGGFAKEFMTAAAQNAQGAVPLPQMQHILQMQAAQPAMSFDGQTMTSRQVNQPLVASLAAGIRPQETQLLSTETQQRMDPDAIAHRLAGQLAPTPEQRAMAMQFFNQFQQGASGMMNAQEMARHNAAEEGLRRQTELVGGVPVQMAVAQLGAQNEDNKTADALTLAQMQKDQNGQALPVTPELAEALMRERGRLRSMGHPAPAGQPPAALLPQGTPPPTQEQQDRSVINRTNSDVGDSPLRNVDQAAVNAILGEKNGEQWKYQGDPTMAMVRLKQLLPPDKYANNPDAIRAFMTARGFSPDQLANAGRFGAHGTDYPLGLLGGLGHIIPMLRGGDVAQQSPTEVFQRQFGMNPAYWQGAADLRQLYPQ